MKRTSQRIRLPALADAEPVELSRALLAQTWPLMIEPRSTDPDALPIDLAAARRCYPPRVLLVAACRQADALRMLLKCVWNAGLAALASRGHAVEVHVWQRRRDAWQVERIALHKEDFDA
jgi:hypothetical protein